MATETETYTLTWTWDQLQTELDRLALGPIQAGMIPYLVKPLRDQSKFLNGELMLREILSLAACIADHSFPPASVGSRASELFNGSASSRPSPS